MFVKHHVLASALVWLCSVAPRHGVLGRSLARASHGNHGGIIWPGDALMEVAADAKAGGRDIDHWAGYQTVTGEYYGTVARINAWNLTLKPGQFSSSVMWLSSNGGNLIMAGFQISPDIYNDTDLHFFVSWTADGFNSTGCLDTQCEGFVSSPSPAASISPGSTVVQPSVYHGKQTDFTITIEPGARNWSVSVDVSGKQKPIGYFPGSLFTGGGGLADHATVAGWGGNARSSPPAGAGPPLGSGHPPGEEAGSAAYVASIGVFDAGGSSGAPAAANVTSLTDAKECYDASAFVVTRDDGAFFYYGGPDGCDH
ncbi:hypothetical protein ACP4OV_007200 [Aristida adscensionis]